MIDEPDELNDERIANHIVAVHQRRETALDVPYKMSEIQNYIKYARTIKPELTPEVSLAALSGAYLQQAAFLLHQSVPMEATRSVP